MKPWLPEPSRAHCMAHYGNMSQLARLKRYTLSDGKAAGVEAVDVETGSGLNFTVLPGRGMDIAWAGYRGVPVAYLSKAGITAPGYHDPREMQWLKSFFAGLVTTCGMANAGPPCRDTVPVLGEIPFGLHGDVSNTGADNVCTREEWLQDGRYRLTVSGRMQEGRLHGEHLQLRREITAYLGEKRLFLHDIYSNEGDTPQPLLFFYHINIGHPVLSAGARFLAPARRISADTEVSRSGLDRYDIYDAPADGYLEQQFFHELIPNREGQTVAALINDSLELGVYIRFPMRQLPKFSQWKVCRKGEYVHAFEPGNCYPAGRDALGKSGALEILSPMEKREEDLEIGILDGADEIAALRAEIQNLINGR